MHVVFEEIMRRCAQGERLALCTLVSTRGSTPQARGAKMLVLPSGHIIGTLGGGCVEAEVRRRALELLAEKRSALLQFSLDHDYGWDDGLICGGAMEIYVELFESPADAARFAPIVADIAARRPTTFSFDYPVPDGVRTYHEAIAPTPVLLIAGAGHVGQGLAALATDLDFLVTILDDRAEYASLARFPRATQHLVADIETELARFPIDAQTYVVIVTRGHRHDGKALAAVIASPAAYIGLIGSRRKILTILTDLAAAGVPRELLQRVHAPVGLDIGAITVPEIAVSIATELVAVRRGKGDAPANPLKLAPALLDAALQRKPV